MKLNLYKITTEMGDEEFVDTSVDMYVVARSVKDALDSCETLLPKVAIAAIRFDREVFMKEINGPTTTE